jgi:glycosyltransferase involved in cell wall biosynthesis
MRLMHVYLGRSYGGIERLLITTLRLRALWPTIEPAFVIYPPGDFTRELEEAGAVVHDLGVGNVRLRNPLSLWRARRRLRELLIAKRSDLVVVHNLWLWAMFGAGARASGLPTVLWLHDPPMRPTDWVTRWARLTRPNRVLCDSDYTAGLVPSLFPGVPVEAVHCPVEPAQLADKLSAAKLREAARTELGLDKDAVVRALAKLRDLPNWVCLQVGRPVLAVEYLERVKQAATDLRIAERVHFLGYRSDLAQLLAASDVHCQPNAQPEPFGIAFVEALYAGLPVVTTAIGGALEIVDESCGILVPPGDLDALAAALGRLIQDPDLRRRLGTQGPARARQLSDPTAQMAKLEAVLLKAASRAIDGAPAREATS